MKITIETDETIDIYEYMRCMIKIMKKDANGNLSIPDLKLPGIYWLVLGDKVLQIGKT